MRSGKVSGTPAHKLLSVSLPRPLFIQLLTSDFLFIFTMSNSTAIASGEEPTVDETTGVPSQVAGPKEFTLESSRLNMTQIISLRLYFWVLGGCGFR